MKKAIFLLMALFLTASLWAAGGQDEAADSAAAEDVTLSVLWFNDGNESEIFMDTVADYLEANPNVKIDMQLIPFGDYEKRLKLMIAGGNPPDLARVTNNHVAMFANNLLPLNGNVDNLDAVNKRF